MFLDDVELPDFLSRSKDGTVHVKGSRMRLVDVYSVFNEDRLIGYLRDMDASVTDETLEKVYHFIMDNIPRLGTAYSDWVVGNMISHLAARARRIIREKPGLLTEFFGEPGDWE